MSYADYTYYVTSYLGTLVPESSFPQLALRASAVIDQITFNRAAGDTTNTAAIKKAMCAVAEELHRQDLANGVDGIASESQGRYSVTYLANSNRSKSNQDKLIAAATVWLQSTYLMFAGFNDGEYGSVINDT